MHSGASFFHSVLAFSLVAALTATAATKAVKFGKLWDGHGIIAMPSSSPRTTQFNVSTRQSRIV
jgi:hypothetical protein